MEPVKKAVKHDSGVADLEKVTDYAEEEEFSSQDIAGAMNLFESRRNLETAKKNARQKELAKVIIKKEDVELIVKELDIPKSVAEMKLREHGGNIVETLITLTD
ncbi:huntingtin-interacting protein K-like [Panonychus citri]|uniref:huntingtin-interacting protein K-like n=1 Tax=Panonychus citri TaxID=50023 RepID=UPI0023078A4B|nr:huntingtin-interacting protein K-like [Panonychus citri]